MSVVYFLALIGALVVIHEFGHFLVAKLLGFKVLRFSLGFGRPLVRLRGGETEYQLGVIPLGGYVRLLGEDDGDAIPPGEAHRAWRGRPTWQRVAVVLAGPAANLALPLVIHFTIFAGDRELPAAVVGDVIAGSPAALAGVEPGDRIRAIDERPVRYWGEVEAAVEQAGGRPLRIRLERGQRERIHQVTPATLAGGEPPSRSVVGIVAAPFRPQIAVIDPASPAGRAGLRTGDIVLAIGGAPVASFTELGRRLAGPPRRVDLTYLRGERLDPVGVELYAPRHASLVLERATAPGDRAGHGLEAADLVLAAVEPGGPAERAGLRPGDLIATIDGDPVDHWLPLSRRLLAVGTRETAIGVRRLGDDGRVRALVAHVRQERRRRDDALGQPTTELWLGASARFVRGRAAQVPIDGRLTYAAVSAFEQTGHSIAVVATGMWSMVRGASPADELGGLITMFRLAAASGERGWEVFLLVLALVSISVGLINLLPVPVLDGGQLVLFALERIRRRPLSPRSRDHLTWVGLAVVGLITMLALGNDVLRHVM